MVFTRLLMHRVASTTEQRRRDSFIRIRVLCRSSCVVVDCVVLEPAAAATYFVVTDDMVDEWEAKTGVDR